MKTFTIGVEYYEASYSHTTEIEADSIEEAREIAEQRALEGVSWWVEDDHD